MFVTNVRRFGTKRAQSFLKLKLIFTLEFRVGSQTEAGRSNIETMKHPPLNFLFPLTDRLSPASENKGGEKAPKKTRWS